LITASELVAPANGVASAFHIRTPARIIAEVIPKTSRDLVIFGSVVVVA
jgi:hypothetical protein